MEISFKTKNIYHTCFMYMNEHLNIYQKSTDNEEGICIGVGLSTHFTPIEILSHSYNSF